MQYLYTPVVRYSGSAYSPTVLYRTVYRVQYSIYSIFSSSESEKRDPSLFLPPTATPTMATDAEWATVFGPSPKPADATGRRPRSNSDPSASAAGAKENFAEILAGIQSGTTTASGTLKKTGQAKRARTSGDVDDGKARMAGTRHVTSCRAATASATAAPCDSGGGGGGGGGAFGWDERRALQVLNEDGHQCVRQLRDALARMFADAEDAATTASSKSGCAGDDMENPIASATFSNIVDEAVDRNPAALRAVATLLVVASSGDELEKILPAVVPVHVRDFGEGTQQFLHFCFHELECGQRYDDMSRIAGAMLSPLLELLSAIVQDQRRVEYHAGADIQMDAKMEESEAAAKNEAMHLSS